MQKYFWPTPGKSIIGLFLEKIPPAPIFMGTRSSIEMLNRYTDGECLGTPDVDEKMASILNKMQRYRRIDVTYEAVINEVNYIEQLYKGFQA